MNKWLISTTFLLFPLIASAQDTLVFGSAQTPDGQQDAILIEQPQNAPNPLGNPIINNTEEPSAPKVSVPKINDWEKHSSHQNNTINENLPVNPHISQQNTPQAEAKKIQDTIYEDDGRIYDIQSVPVQDINRVEEPNIQPTITTYPSY